MTSKIFGYIRVSSKEQNLDRQLDILKNTYLMSVIFFTTSRQEVILIGLATKV